ncbi:MAG: CoA transferase [Caulobacteraceae bacterium]|nr:CoA transferase [Caulobacteraceae bacterium]
MFDLLKGVRILESAVLMTGDFSGRLFADLGADVIKVENPRVGDYLRDIGGTITPHNSVYHLVGNRNKRSVTLNLKTEEGQAIFWELHKTADVFLDGFAGDACAKLGIGYEAQKARKPDIIYAQVSGYGAQGPYARIPTHGQMMNALAGGAPLKMDDDGFVRPDPDKTEIGPALSVQDAAVYCVMTTLSALVRRGRTGEGCYIDTSAADAVIANSVNTTNSVLNDHRITDRDGVPRTGDRGGGAKYQCYQTKDKKFVLFCAMEHKFWDHFCRAVGREDLLHFKDDKFVFDWGLERDLRREVQAIFHTKTQREWVDIAIEHDIAIGPANSGEDFRDDPHIQSRGIIFDAEHPDAGTFTYFGWPSKVSGQHFDVYRHAPAHGEQTDEILRSLGRSDADIARLRQAGIV